MLPIPRPPETITSAARHVDALVVVLDDLQHLGAEILFPQEDGHADDLAPARVVPLRQGHHARAHGGHLGPGPLGQDGGHDVAAEGGTRLHQQALIVDGETRAVGRQAGLELRGHGAGQVAPQAGGADQHDLGLVPSHQVAERSCSRARCGSSGTPGRRPGRPWRHRS